MLHCLCVWHPQGCSGSRVSSAIHNGGSGKYITQYLISELYCDPSTVNNDDNTPLHIACMWGHAHIVQYLLSTGKVDPLAENKYGHTPVYYASRSENSYDLLKLFHPFEQCKKDFPVHTFTKLILTGYSGAGKTTVAQLVVLLATISRYK